MSHDDETIDPCAILPTLSRSELERIIRERLSEGDDALGSLVLSLSAEKTDKRTPAAIVERFARRHLAKSEYGFIEDSYGFAVDLRRIFERAEAAAKNGAYRFAIELIERAVEASAPHAFDGVDEEGEILNAVEAGLERLAVIARSTEVDSEVLGELAGWALRGVDAAWARDGDSWEMACLELAALAARGEAETRAVLERCSGFTKNRRSEWSWAYRAERAALIAAGLLKRNGDEAEWRDYIEAHLFLSNIRKVAVDEAMAAREYGRAIELCRGILSADGGGDRQRSADEFAERLIGALDALGDKAEAAQEFEKLCLRSFSIERYDALKKRCIELRSWSEVLARVIAGLGKCRNSSALAAVYEVEGMIERLLALAERNRFVFEEYLGTIGRAYPARAARFLKSKIEEELRTTSNRGSYARSAERIFQYGKYEGKGAAETLIESLLAAYPARRAMREELEEVRRKLSSER